MNKLEAAKRLQNRTKHFAIEIIKTFAALPKAEAARVISRQFLRSGTAVAANYRAACRARSLADFISKLVIVLEEADETLFWIELLVASTLAPAESVALLRGECGKLFKIFASSLATVKSNR